MRNKPFYLKNIIFIFGFLVLFANILPIRAEEKATQGNPVNEWLNCLANVRDEFSSPIDECLKKHDNRYWECDKVANEFEETVKREVERRCAAFLEGKVPSPNPTEQSTQNQASENNPSEIPNYTKALIGKPPKASDFQNIPQSDFTIVSPAGKAPATQKLATDSASIKDSIFIGKVGGKGEVVVQSPNGETITLTDDRSGYDLFNKHFGVTVPGPQLGNPTQLTIREVDCHLIALRNDNGNCDSSGRCRYPDIWDAQTRIDKTVGDCTYLSEGGPVRVLTQQGQVTFKTPGDVVVAAENADFGIGYDTKSNTSIIEVYNGLVTVTNKAGQAKNISTVYGSKINQIEVNKDGDMTEKIAIPLSEWEAFLASQEKETESEASGNALPIIAVIVVLGMGGAVFFLYRKNKLPQKLTMSINNLIQKIRKSRTSQGSQS